MGGEVINHIHIFRLRLIMGVRAQAWWWEKLTQRKHSLEEFHGGREVVGRQDRAGGKKKTGIGRGGHCKKTLG